MSDEDVAIKMTHETLLLRDEREQLAERVTELERERDGVMANFEHDADCSKLAGGECDCWLWLRTKKNTAEAKLEAIQGDARLALKPELLDDCASIIDLYVEHPFSTNIERLSSIAAELRVTARLVREQAARQS